jgi:two-component system cell cycle sensor histidine kinase/response regulator CckA
MKPSSLAAGLRRDLIQQLAYLLLVLRVVEGLGAWLLFNEVFATHALWSYSWLVHTGFFLYFASNLGISLQYHAGRASVRLLLLDVLGNLLPFFVAIGFTGGIASPLVWLVLLKLCGYAFVFGPEGGLAAIYCGMIGFVAMLTGDLIGLWSVVPISVLPADLSLWVDELARWSILVLASGGAVYVLRRTSAKERQMHQEMARAREAAERERSAAGITGALLSVSEVISRLTRLDEILAKVVDVAPRVLSADYCSLFLWREDSGVYVGAAAAGVEQHISDRFRSMRLRPEEVPDLEWVRRLGHCAMVSPSGWQPLGVPEVPTLLIVPLLSGGRFFGVMQLARRRGGAAFTQGDLQIADGVAGQTAVALERARLIEEGLRLVRAVESTGEAVVITDARRRIRFVNAAFLRTFGYRRDELIGRDASLLTDSLSPSWVSEITAELLAQGWRGETMARRRDGLEFPILLDASLIRDEREGVIGAVAILEDISEQKALQEQLRRADRLAASGELAAGIAHEVNNALVGILAQADLATGAAGETELRTALGRVAGQGRRIASIVQALLGFARPQPPSREPVELPAVVTETLALLDHDLRRHAIRVVLDFPPALAPALADAKQIEQVLVNLFTNAVQAMPGGGTLTVSGSADDERIRLDVSDTGPGISPDRIARIFDPFFTTKREGSGLGLSVSYGIARAHDGDLTVRSEPGQGATFTLVLPSAPRMTVGDLRTALVVDDDDQVSDALLSMLRQQGLSAERVASGAAALAALSQRSFDVDLLDDRLPDISGPEIFTRLQASQPALAQRVIFVTGGLWRSESRLGVQLPAQPSLSKPCSGAQLREALHALSTRLAA